MASREEACPRRRSIVTKSAQRAAADRWRRSEDRAEEAQSMADEPLVESGSGVHSDAPTEKNPGTKDDHIRERAYQIWVDEGQPHGRELDHWLRAKWEVEG